jgi:hypothetical protein
VLHFPLALVPETNLKARRTVLTGTKTIENMFFVFVGSFLFERKLLQGRDEVGRLPSTNKSTLTFFSLSAATLRRLIRHGDSTNHPCPIFS